MNTRRNISIHEYEIGKQHNYDLLDFYMSLKKSDSDPEIKEYHHSLFYPILCYCIDVINSTLDLNAIKYKVGLYKKNKRIYVTVGRDMYDLFFTEKTGKIDNVEIEFSLGKNEFLLNSIHENNDKGKNIFKDFYKLTKNDKQPSNKIETLQNIIYENEEDENLKIFIHNKKYVIISSFLRGYSHQESILKTFESKIKEK